MSGEEAYRAPGFLLYQAEDGKTRVECRFDEGTIWLNQILIAELFQTSVPNVSLHLKNIYAEGELNEGATVKEYLIVRQEGSRKVSRTVRYYNLEAILAVGYRVDCFHPVLRMPPLKPVTKPHPFVILPPCQPKLHIRRSFAQRACAAPCR